MADINTFLRIIDEIPTTKGRMTNDQIPMTNVLYYLVIGHWDLIASSIFGAAHTFSRLSMTWPTLSFMGRPTGVWTS